METEESLLKRSRKILIAATATILLGTLLVWIDHIRTKTRPLAFNNLLESELPASSPLPAGTHSGPTSPIRRMIPLFSNREKFTMLATGKAVSSHDVVPLFSLERSQWSNDQRLCVAIIEHKIVELRKLLLSRPAHVPPIRGTIGLRDFERARSSLHFHVLYNLKKGDITAAIESTAVLVEDAWWNHSRYGIQNPDAAIGVLWEFLQHDQLNELQLAALTKRLESIWSVSDGTLHFNTTRQLIREEYKRHRIKARTRWDHFQNAIVLLDGEKLTRWFRNTRSGLGYRLYNSHDEEADELEQLLIDVKAWKQGLTDGNMAQAIAMAEKERSRFSHIGAFTTCSLPTIGGGLRLGTTSLPVTASRETIRRLVTTVIALERWRLAHDDYPGILEQLVPSFLDEVPLDVMDGKPLRYRRIDENKFDLYSIGLDGYDNHGRTLYPEGALQLSWFAGADWIWPHKATAAEFKASKPASN